MATRRPRALSFDLDDTLWACDDVIDRSERVLYDWLQRHYPRITAAHDLEGMRAIRLQLAGARPHLAADLSLLRLVSLRRHAREAGYPETLAEQGLEVFLAERHRVVLYPEVLPLLRDLRARFPLIALTNGNASIDRIGIGQYFDVALSAADVGAAKPDPAMFHAACRRLSIRTGDLLHVGDDPLRDVHAARSIGARAVWVNRCDAAWPGDLRRANHEITTLVDLPPLL